MSRFHINPKTGDPGPCRAEKVCPFGDLTSDHYDSRESAREAYEAQQEVYAEMRAILTRTKEIADLKGVWIDLKGGEQINGHVIEVTDDAFVVESKSHGVQTERVSDKSGPHALIPLSAVRRIGMNMSGRQVSAPGEERAAMVPASMLTPGTTWMGAMVTKVEKLSEDDERYSPSNTHVYHLSNGRQHKAAIHTEHLLSENDMSRRDQPVPAEYLEAVGVPESARSNYKNEPVTWGSVSSSYSEKLAELAAVDFNKAAFKPEWKS